MFLRHFFRYKRAIVSPNHNTATFDTLDSKTGIRTVKLCCIFHSLAIFCSWLYISKKIFRSFASSLCFIIRYAC